MTCLVVLDLRRAQHVRNFKRGRGQEGKQPPTPTHGWKTMPPFRRVHADDKALASEPIRRIMTWCPTMDLLAFVLGEGVSDGAKQQLASPDESRKCRASPPLIL